MKILHLSTGFPLSFQGGITNYVRILATVQKKNGYDVWVMGGKDEQKYEFKYIQYESKHIKPFTLSKMEDSINLDKIDEFLKKEKFDIIHIHMILDIDWNLYDIIKNYNYIISLHDYFYLCPRICMVDRNKLLCSKYEENRCKKCIDKIERYRYSRFIRNKFSFNISFLDDITTLRYQKMKKLLEGAKVLLPVSKRVKEIYVASGINNNYKILHIGNILADRYKSLVYEKQNFNKRKINIAMLGSLSYLKGVDLFIKLAEQIDHSKFNIYFYGRSGKYKNKIEKVGIIDKGAYKQEQLDKILLNIDLGLVLSIWEDNAPQVVMEFLNNNVPVVGTKMGGIPDFINMKNGYLFNPYLNEDWEKLIKFFNNISVNKILELKNNIKPTKTTNEHYNELMDLYNNICYMK